MAPGTLRSGSRLPLPLKILIVAAAALLLAAVAVFAALFAVSRSRSGDEADRLCATMTERGFFPARLFFSSEKIELSKFYLPPSEPDGPGVVQVPAEGGQASAAPGTSGRLGGSGKDWAGCWYVSSQKPSLAHRSEGGRGGDASLGLDGTLDALLSDGILTYAGDGGDAKYCVVAADPGGKLHIGGKTVYEIANSGYEWAVSADRVLISGGVPQTGLGGGYAPRAAIGQRADGADVVFCASSESLYPCGMTYDELASVMYGLGCAEAAALKPAGGLLVGGKTSVKIPGSAERSILFPKSGADAGSLN